MQLPAPHAATHSGGGPFGREGTPDQHFRTVHADLTIPSDALLLESRIPFFAKRERAKNQIAFGPSDPRRCLRSKSPRKSKETSAWRRAPARRGTPRRVQHGARPQRRGEPGWRSAAPAA
eukprot:1185123-Prorocentrum_minimum.AAC.4